MNRHDTLKVFVEDGVLTMCIGIEVIAKAVTNNPDLMEYDERKGDWDEPEITDLDKFAAEIVKQLLAEDDDGTTPVHIALDTATINAIEMGCEGIKLPSDH